MHSWSVTTYVYFLVALKEVQSTGTLTQVIMIFNYIYFYKYTVFVLFRQNYRPRIDTHLELLTSTWLEI